MRPRVMLLFGDSAGVGPEICIKTVHNLPPEARLVQVVLTGDGRVYDEACRTAGIHLEIPAVSSFKEVELCEESLVFWDLRSEDTDAIPRGEVSAAAGKEVLAALRTFIKLVRTSSVDGLVFAPFNKESMHLAGSGHGSELELFKEEFNRPDIAGEINVLDDLWLARVTSHIAVSRISENLDADRICGTIELLAAQQERSGVFPKIAVAALNPHGGENGMFGDEEGRIIAPAIESVRRRHPQWTVEGPMPADTLFPRAMSGGFTGVVGMYHDQLQIASKIIGLERGVTFHPGMPVPIATAAHGTAFDIQGTGKANHTALNNALALVARMAARPEEGSAGRVAAGDGPAWKVAVLGTEHIGMAATDSEGLARWYGEVFGAGVISRSADDAPIIFLGFGGGALLELIPGRAPDAPPGDHVHLCFAVASLDHALRGLEAAGTVLAKPVFTAYDGSPTAFFRDPEGNLLQVVQRESNFPQPR